MTLRPTSPFLPLLLLSCLSPADQLACQDKSRYDCTAPLLVHYDARGTRLDNDLINGLLTPDRYRPIMAELLAGTGYAGEEAYAFLSTSSKPPSPQQPEGVFATRLTLRWEGVEPVTPATERKLLTRVCAVLQEELQARLVDQQQRPLQELLQMLRQKMEKQQARTLAARRELLQATPLTSVDKLRERAGELDRRQRDLELDLRTEQALQDLRLKLTAEATQQLKDVGARRRECTMRLQEAQNAMSVAQHRSKPDERELAKAGEEMAQRETLVDLCTREQNAAEHDLEELANQARGATLKLHELATRRSLTADEQKRTIQEVETAAERAAALVPLEQTVAEAEAELALLREQYAEASRRAAAVQPVRVELWR